MVSSLLTADYLGKDSTIIILLEELQVWFSGRLQECSLRGGFIFNGLTADCKTVPFFPLKRSADNWEH